MRAPQIYTKFDQDLLFQIRISARASKINDMVVRRRRNEQTHPSRDLPSRCAASTHDRGRKTTGEGGAGRASKAGGRGRPEEGDGGWRERVAGVGRQRPEGEGSRRRERVSSAWAGGPMGNKEELCERGE